MKLIADVMILLGVPVDESAYGPVKDGEDTGKEQV